MPEVSTKEAMGPIALIALGVYIALEVGGIIPDTGKDVVANQLKQHTEEIRRLELKIELNSGHRTRIWDYLNDRRDSVNEKLETNRKRIAEVERTVDRTEDRIVDQRSALAAIETQARENSKTVQSINRALDRVNYQLSTLVRQGMRGDAIQGPDDAHP